MIVIYGTHVQNNNISRSFFHFFKILILWVVREVKRQKMVQNNKKICLFQDNLDILFNLDISGTTNHMIVIYGTQF